MSKINNSLREINKIPNYIYIFIFSILGIIYIKVALTTKGYDDEFWTIGIIENTSWLNMIRYFQTNDIHPPLSYIFDRFIFQFLQNWNYVRAFLSTFLIASTLNLTFHIKRKNNDLKALTYALFFLCNPAVLMWGTSIRWYAYFLIIFNWLLIIPEKNSRWFDIKLICALLLLSLTGYITFIFIIPIFLYYYSNHKIPWYEKFTLIFKNFLTYILLYSFQLFFFIKFHASSDSDFDLNLFFPLKNVLVGFFSSFLSNQGVLPFSSAGVLSAISTSLLLFFCFYNLIKSKPISNIFIPLLISLIALITSGAAGYLRIFVTLIPIQSKWISDLNLKRKEYFFPILIILISQLIGIQNVITQSGTTKTYFNLPVQKIIEEIDEFAYECGSNPVVFHHIKALSFHLNRQKKISISHIENWTYKESKTSKYLEVNSPYKNINDIDKIINSDNNKCAIVVDNFRGFNNFSYSTKMKMLDAINKIEYSSKQIEKIGINKNIFISKKLAVDYPKNSATLYKFVNPKNLNEMKIWFNLKSK